MDERKNDALKTFDLQAERSVAGSVLFDTDAALWPEARALVQESDFTIGSCRSIWTAACRLLDEGRDVDTLTVIAAAGVDYNEAMAMLEACPTAAHVCDYAALVHAAALRRQGHALCAKWSAALDRAENPLEPISGLQSALEALAASGSAQVSTASDLGSAYIDFLYGETGKAIPSGFLSLDYFTGGFFPGRVYTVGARSGVGKSAFALALAQMAAKKHRVFYLSLEMNEAELAARIISSYSGVPYCEAQERVRHSEAEATKIAEAGADLGELKLSARFLPTAALSDVSVLARGCKAELLVVDYVQLLRLPGAMSEYERITQISAGLKQLAGSLKIPVIVLAQLNRAAVAEAAPGIHNLKGSGSLEQDSDVVLLLDTPKKPQEQPDGEKKEPEQKPQRKKAQSAESIEPQRFLVKVAKNRHGKTGTFELQWWAGNNRFTDEGKGKWHCNSWV